MDRQAVLERVVRALADTLELSEADISEDSLFKEDLDADSLDLVELLLQMEKAYGFKVNDDEAAQIKSVRDAVDLVMVKAGAA